MASRLPGTWDTGVRSRTGGGVRITLALLLATAAFFMAASRWVDVAVPGVVVAVQALAPYAVLPAGLAVLLAAVPGRSSAQRRGALGLAVVAVGIVATTLAPWWAGSPVVGSTGAPLTVVAANLQLGRADVEPLAAVVRERDVDVLVLTEATSATDAALRDTGLAEALPHRFGRPREGAGGTLILAATPLTPVADTIGPADQDSFDQPVAEVDVDGVAVTVQAVHPQPPHLLNAWPWRDGLSALTSQSERGGPLVQAGDFNATVDHPAMRELLGTGLRDARELAGAGRTPTWPQGGVLPPLFDLDRVLVRDLGVVDVDTVPLDGSDHTAVLAELVLPDPTGGDL